jgi:GAF domain-containing protein
MGMFVSPTPVFFNDVFNDERVDATTLELVAKRLNLRSVAVLPLYSANKQIGALVLEGEEPHNSRKKKSAFCSVLCARRSLRLLKTADSLNRHNARQSAKLC